MSKNIGEGLLENDIVSILNAKSKNPSNKDVSYYVSIHTVNIDLALPLLESIEVLRDYVNNYSDYILVTFKMGLGDYIKDILPFSDNLEMTMIRRDSKQQVVLRYKLVLVNNVDIPKGDLFSKMTKADLNKADVVTIQAQCVDRYVEALRTINVDGIYRYSKVGDLLRFAMDKAITDTVVANEKLDVKIDCVEPNNDRVYKHIEVPTGTKLLDLPSYLQNTNYGVYNGDIGTYFQLTVENKDNVIYVYPLLSSKLFDSAKKKLIVYKTINSKLDYSDNTYFEDGDILKIISGSNVKTLNTSSNEILNSGTELVKMDPDIIAQRNNITQSDKTMVANKSNLKGSSYVERNDSGKNTTYLGNTDNLFPHRSAMLKKTMGIYQIQWNHSVPDLIYPGMPVMYVYEDSANGVVRMYGTVQIVYTKYMKATKEFMSLLTFRVTTEENKERE